MIEHTFSIPGHEQQPAKAFQAKRARREKIEQIRASIKRGTYYIPSDRVAEKIISRMETRRT